MKKTRGILVVVAWSVCHLYGATLTCSFNGGATTSNCYGAGVSFAENDNLNIMTQFGSATQAPIDTSGGPLTGSTGKGLGVQVSLGPGGTTMANGSLVAGSTDTTYLAREDNTSYVWAAQAGNPSTQMWYAPGDAGAANDPAFYDYGGHFSAPSQEQILSEAQGGWGDYLLGPTQADATAAVGTLKFTFSQPVSSFGMLISSVSNGAANTRFTAEIDAYNGNTLLGSYLINAGGSGGFCPSVINNPNPGDPAPCNNAPFIGFSSGSLNITSVYVYGKDATGDNGFFVADIVADDPLTPEPAEYSLMAGGLLVLGLLARKRSTAAR